MIAARPRPCASRQRGRTGFAVARWVGLSLVLHVGACGPPGDAPADDDATAGDDDTSSVADDDTTEDCDPTIAWGFGGDFEVGQVVGNWSLTGYVDADRDGQVEPVEVAFNLEDIHCAGYQTVVVVAGDST